MDTKNYKTIIRNNYFRFILRDNQQTAIQITNIYKANMFNAILITLKNI